VHWLTDCLTISWITSSYFPMTGFRATWDNRHNCAPTPDGFICTMLYFYHNFIVKYSIVCISIIIVFLCEILLQHPLAMSRRFISTAVTLKCIDLHVRYTVGRGITVLHVEIKAILFCAQVKWAPVHHTAIAVPLVMKWHGEHEWCSNGKYTTYAFGVRKIQPWWRHMTKQPWHTNIKQIRILTRKTDSNPLQSSKPWHNIEDNRRSKSLTESWKFL